MKISDDPGTAAQTKPRIGVDAAGNLVAAWIDARTTPAKVRVARKPSGGAWSASIEISPAPANVQSFALAVRPDGYAWATWGDTRGTSQDIWGSRYDPYLSAWSAPQRLDDDPGTTAAQLNPAVAYSTAETMLAWRDNRLNANGNTQARRVVFAPGLTDHFALAYDGLNRLKSVSGPVSESFALDQASNIDSRTGPIQDFSYDQANRLTSDGAQSFTWSNADRLAQRGADVFGYDALDRLTSSTVAGTSRTYAYNGDGLLRSRTQGGATQFLWDPSSSPSRLLKQGGDHIVYGLGPLYVVKVDATTLTFARDGSKNVRAEVSSAGAVTAALRYRAYGQLAQSTTTGPTYLGLASQLIDPSGLYYMRARWYEPITGRFLSRDPLRGDAAAPTGLNAFGYASATPLMASDPSGLRDRGELYGAGCDDSCNEGLSKGGSLGCFDVAYCNFNNNLSGRAVGGFVGLAVPTLTGVTVHFAGKEDPTENEIAAGSGPGGPPSGSKERARQLLAALAATPAQRAAANRAIGRATTSSSIAVVRDGANVVVKITRKGRDGYQVMESVVGADGNKSVVQRTVDSRGIETLDPKTP